MKFNNKKRLLKWREYNLAAGIDLILAVTVLITTSFSSLVCYASIVKENQAEIPILEPLKKGNTSYILSQQDACNGHLNILLEQDKTYHLLADSKLSLKAQNNKLTVNSLFEAYFNGIGQLQSGRATVFTDSFKLQIEANGVTPIELNVKAITPKFKKEFSTTISGPIEIVETSNSNFGIRYTNFNKLPALPNLPKASSANLIDISLIEVDKENHNCSSNELTPINIDKILNQMTQILNMTAPFINGVQQ